MKKNILILVCFVCFFTSSIYSQNYLEYYRKINDAEINNLNGNYAKSDSLYNVAFTLVKKPLKEDFFLAALNAEKLRDNNKVYKYLSNSLLKGLRFKRIKKERFKSFKNSLLWKKIKKNKAHFHQQYISSLDIPLQEEIIEMIKSDQKARRPIFGSWKQMKKTDTYNFKRLLEIIKDNNGAWPGFSKIGELTPKGKYDVTGNITLLLLHFSRKQIEILKPYMLKAVLSGEMYPYQYARAVDYVSFKNNLININGKIESCSFYGTYANSIICDCKKAEEEREKIGFEPLSDFYRKIKSTYKCKEN